MKYFLLLALLALTACAPAMQPLLAEIPHPKNLESVRAERVSLAGFDEPNTPNQFDQAFFVRYSLAKTTKARVVLILMPGFLGGAANFDRLARSMVAKDPSVEVWAVDRRSNQLEEHGRLQEALAKASPLLAWEYHIGDAGKANGFKPRDPKDLKFMGFWGLQVHLEDLRRVVLLARTYGNKVLLGGHSLGAVMVSLYAGWDFAGTPGHKDIDGLVLLDGVAGRTSGENGISQADYQTGSVGPFGIRGAGQIGLENGSDIPYFSAFGFDPTGLSKLSTAALLARFDPNGDSPGGIVPYPASNLAAGMISGDDQHALVSAFAISAGQVKNAKVSINVLSWFVGGFALDVVGVADGANRVEWEIPSQTDSTELTDPIDFATRFYTPQADFQEWYFPARLSLDIGAVGLEAPTWAKDTLRLQHVASTKIPVLAIRGGRGIVTAADAYQPLEKKMQQKIEVRDLPGMTHLDVLSARANPSVEWLLEFSR
jgi:pimeloyl-ACP methyl ester carboxylesterase